jgi:hypothetical protein
VYLTVPCPSLHAQVVHIHLSTYSYSCSFIYIFIYRTVEKQQAFSNYSFHKNMFPCFHTKASHCKTAIAWTYKVQTMYSKTRLKHSSSLLNLPELLYNSLCNLPHLRYSNFSYSYIVCPSSQISDAVKNYIELLFRLVPDDSKNNIWVFKNRL